MFGNQNMQNDSSKTVKLILAIGLVTAALIASAGVFYYYAIFAPNLEKERVEFEQQKREEELAKQLELQKELKRKEAYSECVMKVEADYANHWAYSCSQKAERSRKLLYLCNNSYANPSDCQMLHSDSQYNPQCVLPETIAMEIENEKEESMTQCNQISL